MKWIKTINELFDTEELKNQHEIPYLSGKLDPKEIVLSVDADTMLDKSSFKKLEYNEFEKIHIPLSRKFLFFNLCIKQNNNFKILYNNSEDGNIYKYYFNNGEWIIMFSIIRNNELYDVGISIKKYGYNENEVIQDLFNYNSGKVAYETFNNLSKEDLYQLVSNKLIFWFKKLGFDKLIELKNSAIN